ncbi:tetraspanin-8-like [Cyprinodon tularosa]|uniref:tetraspanin-8-like n=1 Tax=Cyprinodon tularosa TaxID=77115 RepID=UPI0018E26DC3|nr:tetraspanin-8-like [Cyprinodon tularosa]
MAVNKCVKYLLFLFNLLFWICGCIILGVGIYLKVSKEGNSITEQYLPSFELMIAIGVIIMVLGFLGCCGASRENRCMLLVFFVLLLIIFALLLAAGILAAVEEGKVRGWVEEKLKKLEPLTDQPQNVKDDLEKLQAELKCCGLTKGPSEWKPPPPSCRCNATATAADKCSAGIYQEPCIDKIIGYMKNHMEVSLGIAFAIAIILIFGMVFSLLLFCQIGKKAGNTV